MTDIVKGLRLLVPSDSSGAVIKAIDEITCLRNELRIAQEWSARVIAGREQDIAEITALRAEVERLTRLLRAEQELGEFYRENIGRLRAEKEKMRAALSKISEYEIEEGCPCNACQHSAIARAALKGETNGN